MSDATGDSAAATPSEKLLENEVEVLDLPTGKALSIEEANTALLRSFSSVILVAGAAECGKTTLLASIYCLFQEKPFAGYLFAGSQTLVGFENRLYFARMASKRETPTFERTKVSEYLHLNVRVDDCSRPIRSLLLCDLCSEDLRDAKDNSAACREIPFFRRADHFVFLIDGDKMGNLNLRQAAKNEVTTLIRNCLETGVLGLKSRVDVLFTKWDKVKSSKDETTTLKFADHVEADVRHRLEGKVRLLRFARVAAHPFESSLPLGYGLEEIFRSWVEGDYGEETPGAPIFLENETQQCEFDRYYQRRLPGQFLLE